METKNHWHLAEFISSQRNWGEYKNQLILGSIMPDINILTYLRGHIYDKSIDMIRTNAQSLIEKTRWNGASFYHLGVILHYIADYFTFPHNTTFKGTLADHCAYEKKFRTVFCKFLATKSRERTNCNSGKATETTYIIQNLPDISSNGSITILPQKITQPIHSLTDLFSFLEKKHHEYLSTMPSIQTDCQYIFSMTNIMAYFLPKLHQECHAKTTLSTYPLNN